VRATRLKKLAPRFCHCLEKFPSFRLYNCNSENRPIKVLISCSCGFIIFDTPVHSLWLDMHRVDEVIKFHMAVEFIKRRKTCCLFIDKCIDDMLQGKNHFVNKLDPESKEGVWYEELTGIIKGID